MSDNDVLDLRELLQKPSGAYPDRPQLPGAKTFFGKLINCEADRSTQKGTPLLRFHVRLTDPGEDVTQAEIAKIREAGFTLADYQVNSDFFMTPGAMPIFRRFVDSLGFPPNVNFDEKLSLQWATVDDGKVIMPIPTDQTQEKIRGIDVIVRTQPMDDRGRVFSRIDSTSIAGVKRT